MNKTSQSKRITKRKREEFLDAMASGLSVSAAARKADIARRTVYYWRSKDREFAEEWQDAEQAGCDAIEDEAFRRAVEGVEKPVYRGGEVVGHVRDYSDAMLIFLLKSKRPDIYRDAPKKMEEGDKDNPIKGAKDALHRKFSQILAAQKSREVSDKSE